MIRLILISLFYFSCCNGDRTYMVSAHGGYTGDTADATIEWTYNIEVWFYRDKGSSISIKDGNKISREFEQDPTQITEIVFQKITKGQQIPDYYFSYGPEFVTNSGIYGQITPKYTPSASSGAFGTLIHKPMWTQERFCPPWTMYKPVKLTAFAAAINDPAGTHPTRILWNACTVYTNPGPEQFTAYSELVIIANPIHWRQNVFEHCLKDLKRVRVGVTELVNTKKQEVDSWDMSYVTRANRAAAEQLKVKTKAALDKIEGTADTAPDVYDCHLFLTNERKKNGLIDDQERDSHYEFDNRYGQPRTISWSDVRFARVENDDNYYYYQQYNALNKIRRTRKNKKYKKGKNTYYNYPQHNTVKIHRKRKNEKYENHRNKHYN